MTALHCTTLYYALYCTLHNTQGSLGSTDPGDRLRHRRGTVRPQQVCSTALVIVEVEELLNISALLTSKNLQCINNLLEEKKLGLLCYVL